MAGPSSRGVYTVELPVGASERERVQTNPRLAAGEALEVLKSTAHALPRDGREPAREVGLVDACAALARLMAVASCP